MLTDILKLVPAVTELVDSMHTSEEEKLAMNRKLFELQATLFTGVMEHERSILNAKADIIKAEAAAGTGFFAGLKQAWRPITMLTFLALVVADSFGLLATPLSSEAWVLLKLGLGGYVVGRSVEKIMPIAANAATQFKK